MTNEEEKKSSKWQSKIAKWKGKDQGKKYLLATGIVIITTSLVMSVASLAMSTNKQETSAQDASKSYYTQDEIDKLIEETIGEIKETIDDLNDAVDEAEEAVEDVKATIETPETPEAAGSGTGTKSASATGSGSGTGSPISTEGEQKETDFETIVEEVITKVLETLGETKPDFTIWPSPTWETPTWTKPSWEKPTWTTPTWTTPTWTTPTWTTPTWTTPTWTTPTWTTPTWTTPTWTTPTWTKPELPSVPEFPTKPEFLSAPEFSTVTTGLAQDQIDKITTEVLKIIEQTLVEKTLEALEVNSSNLESVLANDSFLPSEANLDENTIANALNGLAFIKDLSKSNITHLTFDDENGQLSFCVSYNDAVYKIVVEGFQTQREHDDKLLQLVLGTLQNDSSCLDEDLVDALTLPSDISDQNMVDALNNQTGISILTVDNVNLNPNDVTGTLTITVNYNGFKYEIIMDSFPTTSERETTIEVMIEALAYLIKEDEYATFISEDAVLQTIKNVSKLDILVEEDLVFASDDATGTLAITIQNHGSNVDITLEGFKQYDSSDTIPANAYEGETLPAWFNIPETVTTIGKGAFEETIFLGWFTIPDSVTFIGEYAFAFAKLPNASGLNIPDNLTTIETGAFRETTIAQGETIPETVKVIDATAFYGSTLPEGFAIPDGDIEIAFDAFLNVKMDPSLTWYDEQGNEKSPNAVPQPGWYIGTKGG